MKMLSIAKELFEVCPNAKLGCIYYTATVEKKNENLWTFINNYIEDEVIAKMSSEMIVQEKHINDSRTLYKNLGKEPNRYRISSEALLRRLLKGKGLYQINNIVDINNLISIRTMYSVGSYDLDRLGENIVFRIGLPGESFKGIGKDIIDVENLPVFADEYGAYGSPTSDSEKAMIRLESTNIVTILISFSDDEIDFTESLAYLQKYTNATNINTVIVKKDD